MDEYEGPITRSKFKQLCIPRSGSHVLGTLADIDERNEQPRDEHHEERQGGGRDVARNQGNPVFENQRRVRYSPLNILGEKHDLPFFPKGTLKEFSGDEEIDAKRHLHLFLDVFDFHHVEHDDVMVRLFL